MWIWTLKTLRLYRRSIFFGCGLFICFLPAALHSLADPNTATTTHFFRATTFLAILFAIAWNDGASRRKERLLLERLQGLQRRVEGLVENITDAVISFDEQYRINIWNPQAEKLFGVSYQEAHGNDLREFLFPKTSQDQDGWPHNFLRYLDEYRPGPTAQQLTEAEKFVFPRQGGLTDLILEYTLIAIPEEEEQIRFVLIIRDLSEREELQLRMIQMDRLAAVGTLAAGVVHEINNPLTYIASGVEFVKSCVDDLDAYSRENLDEQAYHQVQKHLEDSRTWIQTIDEGAQRIHKIVGDMQVYFHPNPPPEERVFSIKEVLDMAVRMTRGEVTKKAQFKVEIKTQAQICSNQTKLSQVFVNLIVNAMHAMKPLEDRRHQLRIYAYDEDDRVIITFSDTGEGMSPEVQRQIFSPFFTTKPMGSGTGLGLSLSRAIVEENGGKIAVESTPGQGSTFRVELPITK